MKNALTAVTISQLETMRQYASSFSSMDGNYICATFDSEKMIPQKYLPIQLDGLTIMLNSRGKMTLNIDSRKVELLQNQLTVISPDTFIMNSSENDGENYCASLIFLSVEFIKYINIDLSLVSKTYHQSDRSPVLTLDPQSLRMFKGYFNMLDINAETSETSDNILSRNIARALTASLVYFLMRLATNQYDSINSDQLKSAGPRRSAYLRDFLQLVHENYRRERTVGFYAKKLFISPKYLSALIKETTGRSAADWIDQRVILEAKNLLRFSGMTVQQVAYALNFNNQSAFGKYFKHLTGISPSAFQKN